MSRKLGEVHLTQTLQSLKVLGVVWVVAKKLRSRQVVFQVCLGTAPTKAWSTRVVGRRRRNRVSINGFIWRRKNVNNSVRICDPSTSASARMITL